MNRPRSEPVTPERAVVISALLIACCAAVFQTSQVAAAPPASSVQTNRSEYQPNDTVIVTGFGWQPGAPITLTFHEMLEKPLHADVVISTFADDGGVIDTSRLNTPDDDFQPDAHDRGLTYQLTATGYAASSEIASAHTTFTDAAAMDLGMEVNDRLAAETQPQ